MFSLSPERFAIPAGTVQEIVRAVAIAALPSAPSVVEGVINFRGRIVPVADPRRRFGMPEVPLHPDQHFIVASAGPRLVALRVDRATELVTISREAIERAADVVPAAPYVAGVARLPDGLLVIHDLERFLSLDETARLDLALQGAAGSAPGGAEATP
ncbi:MAG: purine-binding chemotaxis protein CheW [Gemmatimonadetes bacterium]|nr:purine-binding chemotaxis protein CheW [Gemmatimonadota bacterium]